MTTEREGGEERIGLNGQQLLAAAALISGECQIDIQTLAVVPPKLPYEDPGQATIRCCPT